MNILFVVPNDYQKVGGLSLPINNYFRVLKQKGHNISFFYLPYHLKWYERRAISQQLDELQCEEKIDCIVAFTLNIAFMLARQMNLKKYKGTIVGFLMDSMRLHAISVMKFRRLSAGKCKNLLRMLLYTYKEKACLKYYSDVVYVSEVDVEYVKQYYLSSNRIHCVSNGTNTINVSDFQRKYENLRIGCLTGFSNDTLNENLYPLIYDIFPEIKKMLPDACLVIAGGGASPDIITRIEKEEGVVLLGFVEELSTFYDSVDIVVTTVRKECGILNRILEAWAYGKPVLGYRKNFKAFKDAREGVHYLAADTPEEFLNALLAISDNKLSIDQIAKSSHELVQEKYTWDLKGEELEKILKHSIELSLV